jgi:dTDP-4-amino-4,6-dideoxygalactose transaminase
LPSEITAAYLYAQLENLDEIQIKRGEIWDQYNIGLTSLAVKGDIQIPCLPEYASQNAHMYYVLCKSLNVRTNLIFELNKQNIHSVFHYQSLHQSEYYRLKHDGRILESSDRYSDCLLRLPLYFELSLIDVQKITEAIKRFFLSK